jgi:hypothetical protein
MMFKVGDTVRCKIDLTNKLKQGTHHVITSIGGNEDSGRVYLRFNNERYGWRSFDFEPIIPHKPNLSKFL